MGADHPGMVHKVKKALAANGLSIDRLRKTPDTAALSPRTNDLFFGIKAKGHCYVCDTLAGLV